jgi:hypothetical protein
VHYRHRYPGSSANVERVRVAGPLYV